jgi:hypothetical protein
MIGVIKQAEVEEKLIEIRGQSVIVDADVAELYGVETRRINEAVKNNPEKFPTGYCIELNEQEKRELVEIFDRFNSLKHSSVTPKAFTEKGLYMLATILKSLKATEATLSIIETFTKVRELSKMMHQLPAVQEGSPKQEALLQKTGELISDLIVPEHVEVMDTEASIELNLALLKVKYSVKKKVK